MLKLKKEYLAYTDKHVSSFNPPKELIENVKNVCETTADGVPYVDIPYIIGGELSLHGYGRFVDDDADARVRVLQWPTVRRPIVGGFSGGVVKGDFVCRWVDDEVHVVNDAVSNKYPKGWRDHDGNIFTQGGDYHPDGEQIFVPRDKRPFILILSKHRHDTTVSPLTFVAFYFDGLRGFAVKPGVYHQAVFPFENEVHLQSSQGKVHGVVMMDSYREFGVYMRVRNAFQKPSKTKPSSWIFALKSKVLAAVLATPSNITPYGHLVGQLDVSTVKIKRWPMKQRPVWMGDECGFTSEKNVYQWTDNGTLVLDNRLIAGYRTSSTEEILTNYMFTRPDGSHLLFPTDTSSGETFVILLALGKDDDCEEIDPFTFTCLIIPPGQGLLINEDVWRSVPFPYKAQQISLNEVYSSVNARIEDDLFASFSFVLKVQQ